MRTLILLAGFAGFFVGTPLQAVELSPGQTFSAQDSLNISDVATPDAQNCLDGLCWKPTSFTVTVERPWKSDSAGTIRFPSAINTENPINDLVALEWYPGLQNGVPLEKAPAILVVHESGSAMPVGRMFARTLTAYGFHTFLIHLPYYGLRKPPEGRPDLSLFLQIMRQGIADVRRARDAIAALPVVDPKVIALQGTSLGGFVAATTAGLDQGFDAVFIMVAGGDLQGVIQSGIKEAADLREKLAAAGFEGEKLHMLVNRIEPNRLAHRLRRERTWLYSAESDQVVPLAGAIAFKEAAGLDDTHHVRMPGDHVTVVVYFPSIVKQMATEFRKLIPEPAE